MTARGKYNRLLQAKSYVEKIDRKSHDRFLALTIITELLQELDWEATIENIDAVEENNHINFVTGKIA